MVRPIARLIALIMFAVIVYLYVEVTSLQREVLSLRVQLTQIEKIRAENTALRAKLQNRRTQSASPQPQETDPLSEARTHILSAEHDAAGGDFGHAYQESQLANAALSQAANSASGVTRGQVKALRSELEQVKTQARSVWNQFGG